MVNKKIRKILNRWYSRLVPWLLNITSRISRRIFGSLGIDKITRPRQMHNDHLGPQHRAEQLWTVIHGPWIPYLTYSLDFLRSHFLPIMFSLSKKTVVFEKKMLCRKNKNEPLDVDPYWWKGICDFLWWPSVWLKLNPDHP